MQPACRQAGPQAQAPQKAGVHYALKALSPGTSEVAKSCEKHGLSTTLSLRRALDNSSNFYASRKSRWDFRRTEEVLGRRDRNAFLLKPIFFFEFWQSVIFDGFSNFCH